jgi:hypothetical protein
MGDRLWMGDNYRVIPPDGIKHNKSSSLVAKISVGVGICFVSFCLFRHFASIQ